MEKNKTSYADLLKFYIKQSGKTLDQISKECEQRGVPIHPTYISKLRLGQRPAPSDEITNVLAEVIGGDKSKLHMAGILERIPPAARMAIENYNDILSAINSALVDSIQDLFTTNTFSDDLGNTRELIRAIAERYNIDFQSISETNFEKNISLLSNLDITNKTEILDIITKYRQLYYTEDNEGIIELEDLLENGDYYHKLLDEKRKKFIGSINQIGGNVLHIDLSNDDTIDKLPLYYKNVELTKEEKMEFLAIFRGILSARQALKEKS